MSNKTFFKLAAISGFAAVALGAFAAHGLKQYLSTEQLQWFETANRYHFYHTIALLAVAGLPKCDSKFLQYAGFAFIVGIVLFSGSLYLMAMTGIKTLGIITPVGGLAFLAGWTMLAVFAIKR